MSYNELKELLDNTQGERDVCGYLKRNPKLVRQSIYRWFGHSDYVLYEFPFGSNYRSDFVVVMSYSGGWDVNLIECEPVDDPVFTKALKPSSRLNSAISQVHDWQSFIELNRPQVQRDLANWCEKKSILKWFNKPGDPINDSGNLLRDPETHIRFRFHIIIGRRNLISKEVRKKMNQYSQQGVLEIASFDRFLDAASWLEGEDGKSLASFEDIM